MFTFHRPDRPDSWPRRNAGRQCLTVALLLVALCTVFLPVTGLARMPESDVPPGQPSLLAPALRAAGVSTAPHFLWSAVPSATSFVLQVSIWPDFSVMMIDEHGITDTTFTPSFLFADGTMYFWRVRAVNDAGSGPWAPSLSGWVFTTETEGLPPPVPVLPPLEAVDVPLIATFAWDAVSGATSYDLELSSSIAFSDIVYQQHGIEGTSHMLPAPLPPATLLFWRIRSVNGGTTSLWSPVASGWPFMTAASSLGRPVQTSPGSSASGVSVLPVLTWEPVAGAAGYVVQLSTREMIAGGEMVFADITGTSFSLPVPLANLTTYFWRVSAVSATEMGMWSTPVTGRIFTTASAGVDVPEPVAPPDGAMAIALPVTLSWHSVAGATGYDVHVYAEPFIGGTDRVISDVTDTVVVLDQGTLVGGMQYHWAVRARTPAGNSAWGPNGNGWSFTTAYVPPAVPILNIPANGAHEIPRHTVLSWWNNSDSVATLFDLQVDTSGSFDDPVIDRKGITGTEVTVVLPPHATCAWRVRAVNPAGTSAWSEVWHFGTSDVAMEAPLQISPPAGAVDVPLQPTFTWGPVAGATAYQLQVSGAGTFTYDFLLTVNEPGIAGTTFRPASPLKKATSYAWRVRGMNATDTTLWSPMFTARTFTTVPPAPPAPALRAPVWGDTLVTVTPDLSWFTAPGASSYGMQVATDEDFANIVFAACGIEGTSVTLVEPLSGTCRYYWRVTARNGGGVSPFSPVWTFVTVASTPAPPVIVRQPVDQHIVAGQTATFIAGVTGTRPMTYQWMKDGTAIAGGTGPCYTTGAIELPDDGALFTCTATNAYGAATSQEARLSIVAAPVSIIRNGTFDLGSAPWRFHSDGAGTLGSDAPGSNGTMAAHVVIDGEGVNVQLYQADVGLEPFTTYELTFRVRSRFGNDLAVTVGQHTCPYTNYGLDAEYVSVGQGWEECSLIFRTTGFTVPVEDARLSFTFGPFDRAGEEYFIDDVAMVKHIASDDVPSLVANAGFERGTRPWSFYTDGEGSLDVDSPGQDSRHAARVQIVASGTNVQLFQSGITLEPNALYRLTFDGYSTTGHDVIVALHRHEGNGESFGLSERTIDLGTGWATHTLLFVARERELPLVDGRLRFWLAPFAAAGDEYFFDDVILERVAAAGTAELGASLVVDPGFEEGGSAWWTYTNGEGSYAANAQGPGSTHAAHVIVSAPGSNIQLSQSIPALMAGAVHQLTFSARSNSGHDLEIGIHQDRTPYRALGMDAVSCELTSTWQSFTFVFRTPDEVDPANPTRVHFAFGPFARANDEYFIDDVILVNLEGGDARRSGGAQDAASNAALIPTELTLRQNYPNPFNPSTTISFGLAEESQLRLVVYDVLGREVVTLMDGMHPAGFGTVVWDATTAGGRTVGSGIYFYRLTAVGASGRTETLVGSMLLMR